ncbi:MAG: uncharacterized protein JWR52_2991 [Marmoricola sp.]|nr:uncharacterized protein [Marmoricola sp.]
MSTTEPLGPDEKLCPFCSQVIKAAAVKCPFCQSDLPVSEEPVVPTRPPARSAHDIRETAGTPEPEPVTVNESVTQPVGYAPPARPSRWRDPVVAGLVVLCLALAGGAVALYLTAPPDSLHTSSDGQVTLTSYQQGALRDAATDAAAVFSYSYKTLAADEAAARAVITPDFAHVYARVMTDAGPKATSSKLTLVATVRASSLVSLTKDRAVVLLFVDALTTSAGSPTQHVDQNRVVMTMTRKDDRWIVSKIDRF